MIIDETTLAAIERYQQNQWVHPLTCGNDSSHGNYRLAPKLWEAGTNSAHIVLHCPDCDYLQTMSDSLLDIVVKAADVDMSDVFGLNEIVDEGRWLVKIEVDVFDVDTPHQAAVAGLHIFEPYFNGTGFPEGITVDVQKHDPDTDVWEDVLVDTKMPSQDSDERWPPPTVNLPFESLTPVGSPKLVDGDEFSVLTGQVRIYGATLDVIAWEVRADIAGITPVVQDWDDARAFTDVRARLLNSHNVGEFVPWNNRLYLVTIL